MKWKNIAAAVGKAAPLLGSILAGPGGAAAGAIVASALGVDATPDAIDKVIKADPEAALKLKKIELDHAAELRRLTLEATSNTLAQINQTMRVEALSDNWWVSGWRPFWGFLSAIAFFLQAGAVSWLLVTGGKAELVAALGALSVFWGVPLAIVGVTAYGRSTEKVARVTGEQPETILGAVAKRIAGTVAKEVA
mgnify:CR=1 FL=1